VADDESAKPRQPRDDGRQPYDDGREPRDDDRQPRDDSRGIDDSAPATIQVAGNAGLPSFHEASSPSEVERPLVVTINPSSDRVRPGDEVEVVVTTTDPQGKPVRAELSLTMIEKNAGGTRRLGPPYAVFGQSPLSPIGWRARIVTPDSTPTFVRSPPRRSLLLTSGERSRR